MYKLRFIYFIFSLMCSLVFGATAKNDSENCVKSIYPTNNKTVNSITQIEFTWEVGDTSACYNIRLFDKKGLDTVFKSKRSGFWIDGSDLLLPDTKYFWKLWRPGKTSCQVATFQVPPRCERPLSYENTIVEDRFTFNDPSDLDRLIFNTEDDLVNIVSEQGDEKVLKITQPNFRKRSELVFKTQKDRSNNRNLFNKFMTYSYKVMIPKSFERNSKLINQWHSQPDFACGEDWGFEGPPPVAMRVINDSLRIQLRWPRDTSRSVSPIYNDFGNFLIPYGKWFHVRVIIKWSMDYDGYVEMYVNGEPSTPYNGKNYRVYGKTLKNRVGNFFKFGLYLKPPLEGNDEILFDNVSITGRNILDTGNDDPIIANHTTLYPNPTSSTITVVGENIKKVTVFSTAGNTYFIQKKRVIDMTSLKSGLYLIKVEFKNGGQRILKAAKL